MNSFSPEQKAFIREVVFEAVPTILRTHIQSCPWGMRLRRFLWMAVGAGVVLGILGVTTIPALRDLLHRLTQ